MMSSYYDKVNTLKYTMIGVVYFCIIRKLVANANQSESKLHMHCHPAPAGI